MGFAAGPEDRGLFGAELASAVRQTNPARPFTRTQPNVSIQALAVLTCTSTTLSMSWV